MDLECLSEPPIYFPLVLHIIALISFPINCFGCYLVVAKSPKNSKYKYCQLYLQIVTFIVENYMSWIGAGYYYFPLVGGYNTSFIANSFITTHTSVVFYFFTFCFELPALLSCFQYRADAAADLNPKKRIPRCFTYFLCILCHSFPFVVATSLAFADTSKEDKYRTVALYFPKCIHILSHPGFVIYDYRTNPWLVMAGLSTMIWVFSFAGYFIFLVIYTIGILQKMRKHMSAATFKLHKTALIALTLQVVIPFSFILIPLTIIFIVVLKQLSSWQEIATDTMFLISCHSMVSTIVMICCNGRYLDVVRSFFTDRLRIKHLQLPKTTIAERTITVIAHN
ncbi:unnamed protein product [Caenorhabditis angaria]|uniref:Serpentine Receptor, class I n=1 Tax=Caenorhabditis angaria TaxID=860376 RepID=A0A9P1I4F3_9PELO|nr:unnamed protein product [Caenorhabditis angaria]